MASKLAIAVDATKSKAPLALESKVISREERRAMSTAEEVPEHPG